MIPPRLPRMSRRDMVPLLGAAALVGVASARAAPVKPAAKPAGKPGATPAAAPGSAAPPQALVDGPPGIVLAAGLHKVTANTTITADLRLEPGARIEVAAGRSLTLLGHFDAPIAHVFTGPGRVDLNRARLTAAFPEWWGARSDDGAADCRPAFAACLAAHPAMVLRAADYYMADTWVVERSHCRIWGAGYYGSVGGAGTRLLVTSATADVVRVGPASAPASINAFVQGVDMRWLELGRTQRPASSAGREPAGLRAQYLLLCQFEGLSARESGIGFAARAVVRSYFRDCLAFRSQPGRSCGGAFAGFYLGGMDNIGLAGANGSIFLTDCNVSIGGAPGLADAVGLLLEGGFADSFIINFETAGLATGIRVDGQASRMGQGPTSAHGNLHLRMPIIDQCAGVGIELRDCSAYALVDITEPYVAVAPGGRAALAFDRMGGAVSISGGQLIGRSDNGHATGVMARAASGLDVTGLKIADFAHPVVIEDCAGVGLDGTIINPSAVTGQPAVRLIRSREVALRLRVAGRLGAFASAVAIEAGAGAVTIDTTRIDGQAIVGGRANAVVAGGRPLAGPGRFGAVVISGG